MLILCQDVGDTDELDLYSSNLGGKDRSGSGRESNQYSSYRCYHACIANNWQFINGGILKFITRVGGGIVAIILRLKCWDTLSSYRHPLGYHACIANNWQCISGEAQVHTSCSTLFKLSQFDISDLFLVQFSQSLSIN
ncbi:hypothetical protein ACTFIY_004411 [Dictyostelium cf. discoideum]